MKNFKVVMAGINEQNNIIIADNLTKKDAEIIKNQCKEKDYLHCFEIRKEE